MIRQLCPNCVQLVEVADSAAGTTISCPKCDKPFPVPATYSPNVDSTAGPPSTPSSDPPPAPTPSIPAPPPGYRPPPPNSHPSSESSLPAPGATGFAHSLVLTLTPTLLKWIPAGCLTLVILLSFFPWIGSYPGNIRMHSQLPWGAAFGYITPNILSEDETALKELVHANWFLIGYLGLLIVAVILTWAERLVPDTASSPLPKQFAWLTPFWPQRYLFSTVLCALMLLLLGWQTCRGFGLETALHTLAVQTVESRKTPEEKEKTTLTFAEEQKQTIKIGQEYGKHAVSDTTALNLALFLHVLALGAAVKLLWLQKRGTKPYPILRLDW